MSKWIPNGGEAGTGRSGWSAFALTALCGLTAIALTSACSGEGDPGGAPPTDTASTRPEASAGRETGGQAGAGRAASAPKTPKEVDERTPEERIAAGRSVYNANCIACHALDPTRDGALGPAVAGSSRELLHARIVDGTYPEGYTPKRPSRVMIALPHLAPKIDELAAYLGSLESS